MKYLLDTCALLWWVEGSDEISPTTLRLLNDPENAIYVSAASVWEIAIKSQTGKLKISGDLVQTMGSLDLIPLPIHFHHAKLAGALPMLHKDPFDRMLVAQSLAEGLTLVTTDTVIPDYGAPVLHP